jgi:hypothetical protein
VISLSNGGSLTGTLYFWVGLRLNQTFSEWVSEPSVRNVTGISIETPQDLLLATQTNMLENENLVNNVNVQYLGNESLYENAVVTSLTYVIVGFVVVDIGLSVVAVGVSLQDASKKERQGEESHAPSSDGGKQIEVEPEPKRALKMPQTHKRQEQVYSSVE